MSHIRLFDRPKASHVRPADLKVTGSLPSAKPSLAYEGRLTISNAVGDCTASLYAGELPGGATVSVDNVTKQVVIAWPAYQTGAAPIENANFEAGETGWELGAGWSTTATNPISGTRSAVFENTKGESIISSKTRYPADTPVTLTVAVRQGASSAGNAGGCARLEWRDAAGQVVESKDGDAIMSTSNNAVKPSTVSGPARPGLTVNAAAKGIRKRQNRPVWFDDFAWNLAAVSVGTNEERTWPITIRVQDSGGRVAFWSGEIKVINAEWLYPGATLPLNAGESFPSNNYYGGLDFYWGKNLSGGDRLYVNRSVTGGPTNGRIYFSDNYGASFDYVDTPFGPASFGGFGLYGLMNSNADAIVTTDGWQTWSTASVGINRGFSYGARVQGYFVLLGNTGCTRSATGAAGTWSGAANPWASRGDTLHINSPDGSIDYLLVTAGSNLYRLESAASFTWSTYSIPDDPAPSDNFQSATFNDEAIVLTKKTATANGYRSYVSRDYGVNWVIRDIIAPWTAGGKFAPAYIDGVMYVGFVLTSGNGRSRLYRSPNDGQSWMELSDFSGYPLPVGSNFMSLFVEKSPSPRGSSVAFTPLWNFDQMIMMKR